jgi:hypothetical protein
MGPSGGGASGTPRGMSTHREVAWARSRPEASSTPAWDRPTDRPAWISEARATMSPAPRSGGRRKFMDSSAVARIVPAGRAV